ncbi:MAG: hypothetical protein ABH952_06795, partial [Candidatus Omnitrophota bacterium]
MHRKLIAILLIQAFLFTNVAFSIERVSLNPVQRTCLSPSITMDNDRFKADYEKELLLAYKYGQKYINALINAVIDNITSLDLTQEFLFSELPQADALKEYFHQSGISDTPEDQVNAFREKVQALMTLDEFLGNLPLRKALLEHGFSLGLTNDIYAALSDNEISGLKTWQEFYQEKGWEKKERVHEHLSELKRHAETTGTPIVFFVPRNIFSHSRASVVKEEISWLLNNPDVLRYVIFVFGSAGTQELIDNSELSTQDKQRFLISVFQSMTGRFEGWISRAAEFKEEKEIASPVRYKVSKIAPPAESYIEGMGQKLKGWLRENSEKTRRGEAILNGDKFQEFYNKVLTEL